MKPFYSLLFAALLVLPTTAFAQEACEPGGNRVSVTVLDPPDIAGDYQANAPIGHGDTPFADTTGLLPPGTTGNLAVIEDPGDGDIDPNLGCTALTNPEEIEGNIAFIQRGGCEFGLKALNAQNAGAIGWLLWNCEPGAEGCAAVTEDEILAGYIGGGVSGAEVTIPGALISYGNGEAIIEQLVFLEVPVEVNMEYRECFLPVANEENVIPGERELSAARPNPFASRTQFDLTLDAAQQVSVAVYNVLGQRVATLHEGALSAATHTFDFEASALPAGVYLIRAAGENFAQTRQVTLVR